MPTNYTQIYYHFVWTTTHRLPVLDSSVRPRLYQYVREKCRELKTHVHAVGGIEDHVHLVVSLPVDVSVAQFMHSIKGASSRYVNELLDGPGSFRWQRGYAVPTFQRAALSRIVKYVCNQAAHHRQGSLSAEMERVPDRNEGAE